MEELRYTPMDDNAAPVDMRGAQRQSQPGSLPGMPPGAEQFQFEPEVEERIIEIPKLVEQIIEKEVVIPETHIVEVVKEIPQIQEVIREVPKYEFKEVIKEIPKVEIKYVERKVEVPQVMVRDIPVEVPQVQEITRMIPRIVVKEIPVERVRKVEKVIYRDVEEIEYVPVPYIVQIEKKFPPGSIGPDGKPIPDNGGGLLGPDGQPLGPGIQMGADGVPMRVKQEVHLFENVNQITKPKLVPVETEVPEYVPQYIDVEVDEFGMPLQPAPTLDVLLSRGVPMEVA
ncbi:unnamed protein product [Amoebophrya sp. A120]|nr:unnamed protein product [Amoebophrya sp. A120]|eukprot:GSA120T00003435001.1